MINLHLYLLIVGYQLLFIDVDWMKSQEKSQEKELAAEEQPDGSSAHQKQPNVDGRQPVGLQMNQTSERRHAVKHQKRNDVLAVQLGKDENKLDQLTGLVKTKMAGPTIVGCHKQHGDVEKAASIVAIDEKKLREPLLPCKATSVTL
jgi:hypothetical protein